MDGALSALLSAGPGGRAVADANGKMTRKSNYRGLTWDGHYNQWRVRIFFKGKQRQVGRFLNELEAAKAYDKAAVYLFKAKATTNFGLAATMDDPTPVSHSIVSALQQIEQEEQMAQQAQQYVAAVQQQWPPEQQQQVPGSSAPYDRPEAMLSGSWAAYGGPGPGPAAPPWHPTGPPPQAPPAAAAPPPGAGGSISSAAAGMPWRPSQPLPLPPAPRGLDALSASVLAAGGLPDALLKPPAAARSGQKRTWEGDLLAPTPTAPPPLPPGLAAAAGAAGVQGGGEAPAGPLPPGPGITLHLMDILRKAQQMQQDVAEPGGVGGCGAGAGVGVGGSGAGDLRDSDMGTSPGGREGNLVSAAAPGLTQPGLAALQHMLKQRWDAPVSSSCGPKEEVEEEGEAPLRPTEAAAGGEEAGEGSFEPAAAPLSQQQQQQQSGAPAPGPREAPGATSPCSHTQPPGRTSPSPGVQLPTPPPAAAAAAEVVAEKVEPGSAAAAAMASNGGFTGGVRDPHQQLQMLLQVLTEGGGEQGQVPHPFYASQQDAAGSGGPGGGGSGHSVAAAAPPLQQPKRQPLEQGPAAPGGLQQPAMGVPPWRLPTLGHHSSSWAGAGAGAGAGGGAASNGWGHGGVEGSAGSGSGVGGGSGGGGGGQVQDMELLPLVGTLWPALTLTATLRLLKVAGLLEEALALQDFVHEALWLVVRGEVAGESGLFLQGLQLLEKAGRLRKYALGNKVCYAAAGAAAADGDA